MRDYDKTIVAIATPISAGAIGIVRLSGKDAVDIADKVFSTAKLTSLDKATPNMLYLGRISSDRFNESCMCVCFLSPNSFTGEDMVELYCHGGVKLLNMIVNLLLDKGASLAENGEFTKRAFLNGKLALSDAEGIVDLINGESEAAINAAYRLLSGKLSSEIRRLNQSLLQAISGLEAALDYPEELEEDTRTEGLIIITNVLVDLKALYSTKDKGKIMKYGVNVAIVGAPNAGKSSLLNAILRDERAIVSEIPGTTRDTIAESVEHCGYKINFIDTAGIRESDDRIERLGVERSLRAIEGADIVIKVVDATTNVIVDSNKEKNTIIVYNKSDIVSVDNDKFSISALTGQGIDELLKSIIAKFGNETLSGGEVLTNLRHIDAVKRAIDHLEEAISMYDITTSDCLLIDIRAAYMALGEIDGSTASENIVDEIFSRFCVGK